MATKAAAAKIPPTHCHHGTATHGASLRGFWWVQHSKHPIELPAEIRGLQGAVELQGRFGRLFPNIVGAQFGDAPEQSKQNLEKLGTLMTASPDPAKDGPDPEESGIPALYTYFGQFVDHDLTFDPNSSLQKQNDPYALVDYRTPAFDLDNIYGRGPSDQPYLYTHAPDSPCGPLHYFLLGNKLTGGDLGAHDLPRNSASPARALIGDPRNDENGIVSQLQGLFLRFHNRMMAEHAHKSSFEEVQRFVRFHYQYIVLHDFLPQIVDAKVLDELASGHHPTHRRVRHYDRSKLKFFNGNNRYMPVEFSAAAYRLGHSMVRPGYRLNDDDDTLRPIFDGVSNKDLRGFQAVPERFGIDWGRFIDMAPPRPDNGSKTAKKNRLQFAYKIDTSLVDPLGHLPLIVASDPPPSLAQRNLVRGFELGLPSGQNVARAMGITPLEDKDIWIGKAGERHVSIIDALAKDKNAGKDVARHFEGNCPLWTYILAEAMHYQKDVPLTVKGKYMTRETPMLGPVGGRIVAEVILGLMFGDPSSLLSQDPKWMPARGADYRLRNFVEFALQEV